MFNLKRYISITLITVLLLGNVISAKGAEPVNSIQGKKETINLLLMKMFLQLQHQFMVQHTVKQ